MEAFDFAQILAQHQASGRGYLEFLHKPSMSVGLYRLKAGAIDPQEPHTEDEVYYIISGRGQIHVGGEDRAVETGTVVFVAANVVHRFHSITEDLDILVFFSPAEYSLKPKQE